MKKMKDLYSEKNKTFKKETEVDPNKWNDILCSWITRINIVKMTVLSKTIYICNAISIHSSTFFHRTRISNLKICMKLQKIPTSQSNLEKKNKTEGIMLLDFRLYYKATVVKTVWYSHKNGHRD